MDINCSVNIMKTYGTNMTKLTGAALDRAVANTMGLKSVHNCEEWGEHMTKDEALKLALEALENISTALREDDVLGSDSELMLNAITAIEEALDECDEDELIIRYHEMTIKRLEKRIEELTAQPQQSIWVGLTDEEILQGNKESWVTLQAWQSAVWWAEAKLKAVNGFHSTEKNT